MSRYSHRPYGDDCKNTRLEFWQVQDMRSKYRSGLWTHKQLGEHYKVHESYVWLIINNRRRVRG